MDILLANPRGFCAGVDRAISIVESALEKFGAPIYVRHEIVHNRHVVERLRAAGVIFIEEVDKARAEYYRSHTGCEVNNTRYRDLFLNSNLLGVEGTADLIVDAVRRKFGLPEEK